MTKKELNRLEALLKVYKLPLTDNASDRHKCGDIEDASGIGLAEVYDADASGLLIGAVNALPDLIRTARKGADCEVCLSKQQEQVRALADENAAKDATIRKLHLLNDTEVKVKREMREKLAARDARIAALEAELRELIRDFGGYWPLDYLDKAKKALEGSDQDG